MCIRCDNDFRNHWFSSSLLLHIRICISLQFNSKENKWSEIEFFPPPNMSINMFYMWDHEPVAKYQMTQIVIELASYIFMCVCVSVHVHVYLCELAHLFAKKNPTYCNNKSEKFKQLPYAHSHCGNELLSRIFVHY